MYMCGDGEKTTGKEGPSCSAGGGKSLSEAIERTEDIVVRCAVGYLMFMKLVDRMLGIC